MGNIREIKKVLKGRPVVEGAGVHLKRALGNEGAVSLFDPFLLLYDFHSSNPDEYLPGFPWHPHRGIETITYVLQGEVDHGDKMGNKGTIHPGDVQWMTAGSGIIHQDGKFIQPTDKKFSIPMCTIGHWKNGVMIKEWLFWDNMTYMKQIGLG